MNYEYLDMNTYKRKSHFDYFCGLSYPYVGLTVNVDITKFIMAVKKKKLPFFLSFCYCIAKAANSVPEFRQRIIDGKIAEYKSCKTSHTVSLEDGTYCYCILNSDMPFQDYLPYAVQTQEEAKAVKSTEDREEDKNELIFISTLPWLSYTALINPVPAPADSNPRITWGKYFTQGSETLIPVSVLCNHALIDGLHISQFYHFLNQYINELTDIVDTFGYERKLIEEYQLSDKDIREKYEFRDIAKSEWEQAVEIEQICFPPNEACKEEHMKERIEKVPEMFLAAVDKQTGKLVGFLNGLATDEEIFRDEFFLNADLYNPNGKNVMLLGLDVLPEYRRQGIGKELIFEYVRREREKGRSMLILTCLQAKVKMYKKMGFVDRGISASVWGGEEWHEMAYQIGF